MASEQDPLNESFSVDFGKQFTQLIARVISIQADVNVSIRNQAKILAHLKSRDEQEVFEEMLEQRDEISDEIAANLYRDLGLSEEFITAASNRNNDREE